MAKGHGGGANWGSATCYVQLYSITLTLNVKMNKASSKAEKLSHALRDTRIVSIQCCNSENVLLLAISSSPQNYSYARVVTWYINTKLFNQLVIRII